MSLVMAALLCAAVGADEYVGASMPQYGLLAGAEYVLPAGGDDYRAAAPLPAPDYAEDASGNADTPTNDIDTDTWKKPQRKQRNGSRRQRNEVEAEAQSTDESLGKAKGSRRRGRARALGGGARGARRARARPLDEEASPPLIDYEDEPSYRKNKMPEDDDRFSRRETTERIIRRKPRDRYVRPPKSDEIDFEEESETDRKLKEVIPNEYSELGRNEWAGDVARATRPRGGGSLDLVPLPPERDAAPPEEGTRARGGAPAGGGGRRMSEVNLLGMDDEEDPEEQLRGREAAPPAPRRPAAEPRPRARHYDYGDSYYDMKRVMNIKNKLPSLMRRPTTRAGGAASSSSPAPARTGPASEAPARTEAPPWLEAPARSSPGGAGELFELLYPARRAGSPSSPARAPSPAPPPPATSSSEAPPPPPPPSTAAAPSPAEASSELTLLERSRLSILKKAQKKEGWGAREASRKPPVLLQVTSKVPTLVMVEPATAAGPGAHAGPWARARPAPAHSPQQLDRVKRLMRRKLIANARSIQDLTDNWDDLVCDYIDTSLLDDDRSAASRRTTPHLAAHVALFAFLLR